MNGDDERKEQRLLFATYSQGVEEARRPDATAAWEMLD